MKGKHRFRLGLVGRRSLKGILFCLPWIVGFVAFFIVPLGQSLAYSLYNIKFTATGMRMQFKGGDNYAYALLRNAAFINELSSFWSNTLLTLVFILVFALALALLLQALPDGRTKGFFRTLYFLPVVLTSGPVLKRLVSIGGTQIANVAGVNINEVIAAYIPAAFAAPILFFFEQLVMLLWYSGVPLLIFLTALQKNDKNQYEAALIDGANAWVVFWKITMPSLRSVIMINAFYTLIFLATSEMNNIITTIKSEMTGTYGYGMACAISWIYSVTIFAALGVIALLCRERRGTKVETVITREQMQVKRLHQAAAERRRNA